MKRIVTFILFLLVTCGTMQAQEHVLQIAEIMPQFPGSTTGLKQWISQNMTYPQEALQQKKEGRVVVKFVITSAGTMTNAKVTRSVSPELDAEALRLVAAMPKWTPGSQGGKPCNVAYTLPITFKLPDNKEGGAEVNPSNNVRSNTDEWTLPPNHKQYNGPFEAFGLFERYGTAHYQYVETGDGKRRFDGKFEFHSDGFVAKGQFSNDYQAGQWEFTSGGLTTVINFDQYGCPNAEFTLYDFHIQGSRILMSKTQYSGYLDHGRFFKVGFVTSNGYHPELSYNWSGECTGGEMKNTKSVKYQLRHGWYRIDYRTGSKEWLSDQDIGCEDTTPQSVKLRVQIGLNHYLLRSTRAKYFDCGLDK